MRHMMKVQSRSNARRRLKAYHPQLETLEVRLPLGDALLSTLLGSSLLGSSFFGDGPSSWASEEAPTDAFPANHRQAHMGTRSALETDTPDTPQILSRDRFRLLGQPSEAQGGNAQTSAVHVVANRNS